MRLPLVLALALATTLAQAAPRPTIDPKIERALTTGLVTHPGQRARLRAVRTAPVTIELRAPADAAALARLQRAGARLHQAGGRTVHYRRFVPAVVDRAALGALAGLDSVARVTLLGHRGPAPLDHSAGLIGVAGARGARPAQDLLTGAGMLVADMDTNADVFHPTFFRADAGAYDWIDVDGDGVFTPGVDAIDLDRNGRVDDGEIGRWLKAETRDGYRGVIVPARADAFDPSVDWVYLDANGNGARDYGAAAGFDDTVPAFGEPLFVPDDANRSGAIEVGERFFRLGTSKFRKIWVRLQNWATEDHVFERGVDLATAVIDYSHGLYGYSDALHASGVLSIVAGDVALAGRRWVGMAPEAEIVLGFEFEVPVATAAWAMGESPDVALYELSPWTGYPLDGTDALSQLIDESTEADGVIHTCPVGDQAGAGKHGQVTVAAGATATLPFTVPAQLGALSWVELSFNARGPGAAGLVFTLTEPGGQTHSLTAASTLANGAVCYPTGETSPRGTRLVDVFLYTDTPAQSAIATGAWTVTVQGDASGAATVDAYVYDERSGFGEGVAWGAAVATDLSTLGIPSVADHCIAVAAHTGHPHTALEPWFYDFPPGGAGEVRDYSPWGPRIDGAQKPDVAAPDNPWVAAPHDQMWGTSDLVVPHGAMWPFGGTSGAAPHVTGVAALLAQTGIRGDAARDAIRAGAFVDDVTGAVPNDRYGFGRLNAAGAFGVSAAGAAPTVTVAVTPAYPRPGQSATLTVQAVDPDGSAGALEAKWDDGYDGTWDTPYGALAPRTVSSAAAGTQAFKVRVRDASGRFGEAIARVTWSDTPPDGGVGDGGRDGQGAGGSDGGCRAAPTATGGSGWAALAGAALLVARRRRRRAQLAGTARR
ncbi:MAG TPA: S8 family serine peptidase [Polyangia bacterium]|jgi:MYXO-CTERM domain-containing protein